MNPEEKEVSVNSTNRGIKITVKNPADGSVLSERELNKEELIRLTFRGVLNNE